MYQKLQDSSIPQKYIGYSLDKLQKMTGLDLRNFDDAIIFKIMLMVSKYMHYRETFMY